ncbi:MAG: peptidase S1 [Proteobacteria bacterium]|nr:peptidase S1 [Pseudomonadota bacterium]
MRVMGLVAVAALAVCTPVAAQNVDLDPSYGTTNLVTGFRPNPFTLSLRSGGSIDAQEINPGCKGFIASAPDVRIIFTSGTLPLIISVTSAADTTLVVHGPDGGWFCDENGSSNGREPLLRFSHPQSGQYDIWVGSLASRSMQEAQLDISEARAP